jgi:putative ABC transport system permease protein
VLRATFRSLLARKLRLLLSATAIVLGVSFVGGSLVLTDTLGRVFDDLFASVNEKTAVEVRGTEPFDASGQGEVARRPVPAELLTAVRAVEGVSAAVGDVSAYAQVIDEDGEPYSSGGAPTFGVNYDADPLTSSFTLREGRPPRGAGEVALDAGTAEATGYGVGDTVPVILAVGRRDLRVSGVFGFGDNDNLAGASIVAFEQRVAEDLLGKDGEYVVLRAAAEEGVTQEVLRDRVAAVLPDTVEAVTGEQSAEETAGDIKEALGFFNTFLLVFAAVALFVGAFLIFNTFTMLVAQRQRELALLRALGASRRQVVRSVLLESLVVGLVASVVGLGLGLGVAVGLQALVRAVGGSLPAGDLVVQTSTVVTCFVVGIGITAVAALLPARRASAVPPVAAMRDSVAPERSLRRGSTIGGGLLALGVLALVQGLRGELALLGLGAVLVFLGVAGLSPLLSRPAARVLGAPFARRVPGRLGRLNAMRNPRRSASTAAALMIGLALVSAVSILGASAKASVERIIQGAVGADLVVQQKGGFDGFSPGVAAALSELDEVGSTDVLRFEVVQIEGSVAFITSVADRALESTLLLSKVDGDIELAPGKVLLSESEAEDRGFGVGDRVPVTFSRGTEKDFVVAGVYEDNELIGPYLFDASAAADFATELDGVVLVQAAEGVPAAELRAAVDEALEAFPTVEAATSDEFAADVAGNIDVVLTIINVLLLLSVIIAVLGIVNTLALSVLERTRELGLLRAVGLARPQVRRMVRVEAVVVSLFGAALGLLLGTAFGVAVQRALADEGISQLRVPWASFAVFAVAAAVAGVVAAILPARRAARLDVLRAIATT